ASTQTRGPRCFAVDYVSHERRSPTSPNQHPDPDIAHAANPWSDEHPRIRHPAAIHRCLQTRLSLRQARIAESESRVFVGLPLFSKRLPSSWGMAFEQTA